LLRVDKRPAKPGACVLDVRDLEVDDDQGVRRVKGISFEVRAGEIVGIAGVAGEGQTQPLQGLFGDRPPAGGNRTLESAGAARAHGLAHVPEDRLRMGLVKGMRAYENAILGYQIESTYVEHGFLKKLAIVDACRRWMRGYDVRPQTPMLEATSFSGGNQQKLV